MTFQVPWRTRCLRQVVVCAALAVIAAGCSDDPAGPGDDPGVLESLVTLESVPRSIDPTGVEGKVRVAVAGSIDHLWDDWGSTRASAPDPPAVPDGHTVVVVWTSGFAPVVDGWRLDEAGALVLVGTGEVPGENCGVPAVVDGYSTFMAVEDERIRPGMPVAEPVFELSQVDCDS